MAWKHSAASASLNIENAASVVHLQLREHKVMRQWRYHAPCFLARENNVLCTVGVLAPAGWH
jgi:hypothetical protein